MPDKITQQLWNDQMKIDSMSLTFNQKEICSEIKTDAGASFLYFNIDYDSQGEISHHDYELNASICTNNQYYVNPLHFHKKVFPPNFSFFGVFL